MLTPGISSTKKSFYNKKNVSVDVIKTTSHLKAQNNLQICAMSFNEVAKRCVALALRLGPSQIYRCTCKSPEVLELYFCKFELFLNLLT
jgi:hypothetical protein